MEICIDVSTHSRYHRLLVLPYLPQTVRDYDWYGSPTQYPRSSLVCYHVNKTVDMSATNELPWTKGIMHNNLLLYHTLPLPLRVHDVTSSRLYGTIPYHTIPYHST